MTLMSEKINNISFIFVAIKCSQNRFKILKSPRDVKSNKKYCQTQALVIQPILKPNITVLYNIMILRAQNNDKKILR